MSGIVDALARDSARIHRRSLSIYNGCSSLELARYLLVDLKDKGNK